MNQALQATDLYKELASHCQSPDKCGPVNGTVLLGVVAATAQKMGQVLDRTCINFEDYTLHDAAHALQVVRLMGRIIGKEGVAQINLVELALLILSAYGHDTGMAVARPRRDELRQSDDYRSYLLRNEGRWQEAEAAREGGKTDLHEHLASLLFQDFLRECHHELSAQYVRDSHGKDLTVEGASLAEPLAQLCRAHGVPLAEVARLERLPWATQFVVDLPYLACVLRLADYLDLDSSRAPQSLMDLIKPATQKSRREWRKHQATQFFVDHKTIRFTATFEDFFEEKALRDTLAGLDRERQACYDLLRLRQPDDCGRRLALGLAEHVKHEIHPQGYEYEEFQFQLEYKEIMSLLMGTRLYRDDRAFVRELLQNALDACRHSEAAAIEAQRGTYQGRIVVRRYEAGGTHVIEVTDNGSGMTRDIIRDYFMRVGRSFYQSFAFRRRKLDFKPVSQFGIGVLSCFMVADYIEVETQPDPLVHGSQAGHKPDRLKLEIRGPHEFFVVRPLKPGQSGTTVRVFLRKPPVQDLRGLIERYLARIPYAVEVHDLNAEPVEIAREPFDFSGARFQTSFLTLPGSFGYASRDLVLTGKFGLETHGRVRFFMLERDNRRQLQLRNAGRFSFIGFNPVGETLLNAKQLSHDIRQKLNEILAKLRSLQSNLPQPARDDLGTILRRFDRLCEELMQRHDGDEVAAQWNSLKAESAALAAGTAFRTSIASMAVQPLLDQGLQEIESFVTGQIKLYHPSGVLTQDGLELPEFGFTSLLRLGVGYLYNIDLCGETRVPLNAARDGVIKNERLDTLIRFLHEKIGRELGEWFCQESIPGADLQSFLSVVPPTLAAAVRLSYSSVKNGTHV